MKKILTAATFIIFAIPVASLLFVWKTLPEKVPMHYNLRGEVDRYGNKSELLLMVAIITAVNFGVYLLLKNVHRIDPKKYAAENKDRMTRMAFAINVFISALLCVIIYSSAYNISEFIPGIIFSGIGILFSFIGNYMYNIKPNYFAGFRLPWTLENEDNWKKTHHLAGKLWFAGGLILAVLCLLLPFKASFFVFFTVLAILVIIPATYSYRLYRQKKSFH